MPEITRADPTQYTLRHIRVGNPMTSDGTALAGPLQYPGAVMLFGESTTFEEIPISELIESPDLVDGAWTARLQDAGDFQIRVPNRTASDGKPWLTRFTTWGKADWIEIKRGGNLEFVGCVERVVATGTSGSDSVTVSGHDGFWCLKSQYERDWQTVSGPRDVCYHATCLRVPALVDTLCDLVSVADTLGPTLNAATWITVLNNTGTVTPTPGGLVISQGSGTGGTTYAFVQSLETFEFFTTRWTLSLTVAMGSFPAGSAFFLGVQNYLSDPSGSGEQWSTLTIFGSAGAPVGVFGSSTVSSATQGVPLNAFATGEAVIVLECDGRWIRGYVNGQLVGYIAGAVSESTLPWFFGVNSNVAESVTVTDFIFETYEPFLMAGADQGDYVLPGTAQTFPAVGLHARYYNDVQESGLGEPQILSLVLNPSKDNPASGQATPYEVVETSLPGIQWPGTHVTSGFATTNWSAKYFGAIWLPLSKGNVPMQINTGAGDSAVRVWIGQTLFGSQLVDEWTPAGENGYPFIVNAAALANGVGEIVDGWYPILIEFAALTTTVGPQLIFGQSTTTLPFSWTDPGSTVFTAGESFLNVPDTSLSPLGCVDQRFQGISYFDMYQQTAKAFGYQFCCEPIQLEGGINPQ